MVKQLDLLVVTSAKATQESNPNRGMWGDSHVVQEKAGLALECSEHDDMTSVCCIGRYAETDAPVGWRRRRLSCLSEARYLLSSVCGCGECPLFSVDRRLLDTFYFSSRTMTPCSKQLQHLSRSTKNNEARMQIT